MVSVRVKAGTVVAGVTWDETEERSVSERGRGIVLGEIFASILSRSEVCPFKGSTLI